MTIVSAAPVSECGQPSPTGASLKPGRDLIVVDSYAGPGTPNVTHERARPVLVGGLRGRKPQHGCIVRLHLHPCRMRAAREDLVNARQVVAGHIEHQMML